jgi:hypothetical protein
MRYPEGERPNAGIDELRRMLHARAMRQRRPVYAGHALQYDEAGLPIRPARDGFPERVRLLLSR